MLRLRKSPQVIPNKKKNYVPDIDDFDDAYIDMDTGEIKTENDPDNKGGTRNTEKGKELLESEIKMVIELLFAKKFYFKKYQYIS